MKKIGLFLLLALLLGSSAYAVTPSPSPEVLSDFADRDRVSDLEREIDGLRREIDNMDDRFDRMERDIDEIQRKVTMR